MEEGTDVWSGGTKEGMKDDARRIKFKRRLQEIAGGVCQVIGNSCKISISRFGIM